MTAPTSIDTAMLSPPLDLVRDGGLEALCFSVRGEMRGARLGYRQKLYAGAAQCAAIARAISEDASLWQRFCNLSLWQSAGRQAPPESCDGQALRWVFKFVEDGSRAADKLVSRQVIAVQSLLDEGIALDRLADELAQRGGFEKIAGSRRSSKPRSSKIARSVYFDESAQPIAGQSTVVLLRWQNPAGRRAYGVGEVLKVLSDSENVELLRRRLHGVSLRKNDDERLE
jgi:hypothetical protein